MQVNKKFANRVAMLRKNKGLTQAEFSVDFSTFVMRKEPFSAITISSWENNSKMPTMTTFLYLCQYFDVSADYLIGLSDTVGEVSEKPSKTVTKKPDFKISAKNLKNYSKEPVYVVFKNKALRSRWGLLDYEKDRIIFTDRIIKNIRTSGCEFYTSIPEDEKAIDYSKKKPYSMQQLLESDKPVWIQMLSADGFIEGKYNGWYQHNEDHSALINTIGLVLPYEGLNSSYVAYPSNI